MRAVRQEQLDFLRGFAATYVVVNHVRGNFFVGGHELLAAHPGVFSYLIAAMLQATSLGFEMVVLFFVLSGFAMAHSVGHSSSVGRFYLKRVVRIWPPYVAAVALAAVAALIIGRPIDALPMLFYANVTTPLTPQFWSLPYEIIFYALCPLVALRWFRPFACAAVAGAMITVAVHGLRLNPWPTLFLNFLGAEALFFTCGIAAYRHFERIPKLSGKALVGVAVGAFVAAWGLKQWQGGPNLASSLVVIAATVLAIRNLPERIPRWANLGYFSYSIYVFHFALVALLVWGLSRLGIPARRIENPIVWMLAVPPVLAGCFLLYWVTERVSNGWVRKIRNLKRKKGRPEGRPVVLMNSNPTG